MKKSGLWFIMSPQPEVIKMIFADEVSWWGRMWEKIKSFFMTPDDGGVNYLTRIIVAVLVIVIGWILIKLFSLLLKKLMGIKKGPNIDRSAKYWIVTFIKIFLYIGLAFAVISILKINVTGVAGVTSAVTVALGLALQDLIGAFAAGLVILQQKNILTGDYIEVRNSYGSCEGTVSKVHFFFTYLNTPAGQEVTVPNSNILKAVVTNYSRLGKRRLDYDVGVAYDTDIELAKKALHSCVDDDPRLLEGAEVNVYVYELGAYSVGMRIRIWTSFTDYWPVRNELSEKVLLALRAQGIRIPSSTDITVNK